MKFPLYRSAIGKGCLVFVVGSLTFLWLSEVTQRKARESADRFMGPLLEEWVWEQREFAVVYPDFDGRPQWFGWLEYYDMRSAIGGPFVVRVDLLGNVTTVNIAVFRQWIGMSEPERIKSQSAMLDKGRLPDKK